MELMKLAERFVLAVERMAANGQALVVIKANEAGLDIAKQPAPISPPVMPEETPDPEPTPDPRTPEPSAASSIDIPDITDETGSVEDEPTGCTAVRKSDGSPCNKPAGHAGKHWYGGSEPAAPAPEKTPVPIGTPEAGAEEDPFAVQPAPPAPVEPAPAAAKAGVTYEDLLSLARSVITATSMETVRDKVSPFGIEKLNEADPSQYDAIFAAIKAIPTK